MAKRAAFEVAAAAVAASHLIFIDEMGIHCGMTRLFARAVGGARAVCAAPRARGRNISVLGALGLRGVVAAMSLEGAVDSLALHTFMEQVLLPELQPGDVVVLDNARIHQGDWLRPLLDAHGIHLLYLPAYSPDFSPLENCWSKVKESLRAAAARTNPALEQALTQALAAIAIEDMRGWFDHCGYDATPK